MSRNFTDTTNDVDADTQSARRKSFIARMERKLELKQSNSQRDI